MAFGTSQLMPVALGISLIGGFSTEARAQDRAGVQPSNTSGGLSEIIVTASKRSTSLQHTAVDVHVLDGDIQLERGRKGLEDLPLSVPNVTFNNTSADSQIYIRGIGNTFIQAGGDPGVAFYSEGAYVTDQRTINTGLFDVERIEVLEGPQGALYGRNAVGGVVNVIYKKPTDTFHGEADIVLGNYGRVDSEGALSGPLGFASTDVRFSYQLRNMDGYTRNLAAKSELSAPDLFDDQHFVAFRLQTLSKLSAEGTLNVIYTHYREHDNGQALKVEPWQGFIYPYQILFGAVPDADPRAVYATVGYTRETVNDLNVNLTQPIGEATLSATGAYRVGNQKFESDCDGTVLGDCVYDTGTRSRDLFFDAHIASPNSGLIRWIIGGTYAHYSVHQNVHVHGSSLNSYIGLDPPDGAWSLDYLGGGRMDQQSFALYLGLKLQLTPIWALTGEIRYSTMTKDADEFLFFPSFGINVSGYRHGLRNSFIPFKVGVEAQASPDILIYLNFATANKDGAINLGAIQASPVLPEAVRTVELGFKTSFLSHRLRVNGAVFHTSYQNLQLQQIQTNTDVLTNAPRSTINGAEVHLEAAPTDRLTVTVNVGYLDARFDQFTNAETIPGGFTAPHDLAGNFLPYVSPVSVNAEIGYRFALPGGFGLNTGVAYTYHGRIYFDEFQRQSNSQKAVSTVDLNASLTIPRSNWRLFGYIHNITNRTVALGSTIYTPLLGSERATTYAPPRMFALGVAASF
jgi:iron complex outermembrane receptor protein